MFLADRLKIIFQEFIYENHFGFLPKRQLRNNVKNWTMLGDFWNIWNHITNTRSVPSLDAEKKFNNLSLVFLFNILEEMKFRENFIKWARFIYTSQKSQIIFNRDLTKL